MKYIPTSPPNPKLLLLLFGMLLCTAGFGQEKHHTVKPGETFYHIASEYGLKVTDLQKANPAVGTDYSIKPGQVLVIPPSGKDTKPMNSTSGKDVPWTPPSADREKKAEAEKLADTTTTTTTVITTKAPATTPAPTKPVATQDFPEATRGYHTVGAKETLATIAKDFGVSMDDLKKWNPDAAKGIKPGMKLKVVDL